jgi:GGDEF domain-containing protein/thioredoxin-like negative regulator of GroEL
MAELGKRPDRTEIAKHLARAEKFLQKGKLAEALEENLQVLAYEPENETVCHMAIDLCLSLRQTPHAVKLLGELFERQAESGDATKASLTYKKLERIVPPTWEQKLRFAQLLEGVNRRLAVETYEQAFQELSQQGRKQDALGVLDRILALDSSENNYARLGELSAELGDSVKSAAAFLKVAELAHHSGGSPATWIEKAYTQNPSDPDIALAYSKNLVAQGQAGAAIFVLQEAALQPDSPIELRETYAKALLETQRLTDAEPVVWGLFQENPSRRIAEITNLIGLYIDGEQDEDAVALARKLGEFQYRRSEQRAFFVAMQEVLTKHRNFAGLLEFMGEQYNMSNREADYCQTLLKLFDLHISAGDYGKAADCLDQAAEVDVYEPGHQKRLEQLRGKISEERHKGIAGRFSSMTESAAAPVRNADTMLGAAALQDMMLQAEILVQYGMRQKATERLLRIQELFPREEERNPALMQLYSSAGIVPQYAGAAAPAHHASAPAVASPPATPPPAASAAPDVSSFTRIAEITRKLYRQNNADAVMITAANEIGAQWKVARCLVAMRRPGLPATAIQQFCAQGDQPIEMLAFQKAVVAVHDLAIARGNLTIADVQTAPELQAVAPLFAQARCASLLAQPMTDGQDNVGLVLLLHNARRNWDANDAVVLKTITDQIVIAQNNAGLRRLVKNLSVTDERSGLLKRASYLDLLMAETKRATQQGTQVSVALIQFGDKVALLKELGESGLETGMDKIGQLFTANLRQNDLAFRYDGATIAIVLGDTAEKEGIAAAEKLQRLQAQCDLPQFHFNAGIAQAVLRNEYDPADIVTEVVNRAEQALKGALAQGAGKIVSKPAGNVAAAVA